MRVNAKKTVAHHQTRHRLPHRNCRRRKKK